MSFGRSCRFPLPGLIGDRRLWLCVVIALTFLACIPASGQDGPPIGEKAPAAVAPAPSAAASKGGAKASATDKSTIAPAKKATQSVEAVPGAKPAASPKADPAPLTGVAAQCANLLNLAKTLKTEVDKTTQDVLSISVVRDAGEIEQMAHKLRASQKH